MVCHTLGLKAHWAAESSSNGWSALCGRGSVLRTSSDCFDPEAANPPIIRAIEDQDGEHRTCIDILLVDLCSACHFSLSETQVALVRNLQLELGF